MLTDYYNILYKFKTFYTLLKIKTFEKEIYGLIEAEILKSVKVLSKSNFFIILRQTISQ
jgi:hypothetical protein